MAYWEVTADNTGGSAKTDFPVKVELTSLNFDFTQAAADGSDVEFRASDGVTALSFWRESYDSVGETASFWVKVPSIAAGGSTTVRLYVGAATDASDGAGVFTSLFEDFTDETPFLTTIGGYVTDTNRPVMAGIGAMTNPIITTGGVGDFDESQVREQSQIVYDAADANADRRYKLFYTGVSAGSVSTVGLTTAPAPEGPWTKHATTGVMANGTNQDPYILENEDGTVHQDGGGLYHCYVEHSNNIGHYTSADLITWTFDADVLAPAGTDTQVGSPIAVWDAVAGEVNLIVEVLPSTPISANIYTGIARGSYGTFGAYAALMTSTGDASDDVVDLLRKIDGVWYLTVHGATGGQYLWSTSDASPSSWTTSSFTLWGEFHAAGNSLMHSQNTSDTLYTFQDDLGDIYLTKFYGTTPKWYPYSQVNTTTAEGGFAVDILVGDGLVLDPYIAARGNNTGRGIGIVGETTFGPTGFEVMTKRKQVISDTGDDRYTWFGFGNGELRIGSLNDYRMILENSILAGVWDPDGSVQGFIRRWSTSSTSLKGQGNVSAAVANDYAVHGLSYLSSGAIRYRIDGSTICTGTDTAHVAQSQKVWLNQASVSAAGGESYWQWVAVRPYDGVDPTVTVTSTGSVVAATLTGTLGALSGSVALDRTVSATATGSLGGLTGSMALDRTVAASMTGTLGGLAGAVTLDVSTVGATPITLTGVLGALTGTIIAAVSGPITPDPNPLTITYRETGHTIRYRETGHTIRYRERR